MADVDSDRPLPILRALIDAVDHEILRLLERRNGIVAEVAAYKRRHRVPIRDFVRERELLADRQEHAARLGLSPGVIESLYRLVLWASRDRQAALKAELPLELEQKIVAIIGGNGVMGQCLANLMSDAGQAVLISDVDTDLTAEEAARQADVVAVSVPIHSTCDVIRQIGPHVRPEALLMDITSIKTEPMQTMLEHSQASVIGTHPLFGPSVHSLQGQRIAVTPGRGEQWLDWLKTILESRGMIIVETDAQSHDQVMAIVQVLTHFSTEVLGSTLCELGVPLSQTLQLVSPVYLMELLMTGRHFAQSPDLYAAIEMSNPDRERVTSAFVQCGQRLHSIVCNEDLIAFKAEFEKVSEFFGDFSAQALEQSSFLIDRLVERT